MKISYNWLKEYIDTELSPEEISIVLTNSGLEVSGVEQVHSIAGGLEGLIVGEVNSVDQHPNADKLLITNVDTGNGADKVIHQPTFA